MAVIYRYSEKFIETEMQNINNEISDSGDDYIRTEEMKTEVIEIIGDEPQPKRRMFIQQSIDQRDKLSTKASLEKSLSEMNKDERLKQEKILVTDMKSKIWSALPDGFSKYKNPILSEYIVCNSCFKENKTKGTSEIQYGKDKSTTNIKQHVQRFHDKDYDAFLLQSAIKIEPVKMTSFFAVDQLKITKAQELQEQALMKFMVNTHQPFSVVDNDDFRAYQLSLNPKAVTYNSKSIREVLRTSLLLKREKLMDEFAKISAEKGVMKIFDIKDSLTSSSFLRAAVTSDSWTSILNETYASCSLHSISPTFDLYSFPFDIDKIEGHTYSIHTAETINNMSAKWNAQPTVVVTDCEAPMVAAWRTFKHGAQ